MSSAETKSVVEIEVRVSGIGIDWSEVKEVYEVGFVFRGRSGVKREKGIVDRRIRVLQIEYRVLKISNNMSS
jgi:hypothetical protein